MRTISTFIAIISSIALNLNAKVKEVEVYNTTNKPIQVAIHIANSPNEIGAAISVAQTIDPNSSCTVKEQFEEYSFINAVIYRSDGTRIVAKSELNKKDSPKDLKFNISEIKEENIDGAEVKKMDAFLEEQIKKFQNENSFVIRVNDDANTNIPEYLGSIVIVDLSPGIADKDRVKKTITARQLGINQTITFKGDNIEKTFRVSKDFSTSVNAKFPEFSKLILISVMQICWKLNTQ